MAVFAAEVFFGKVIASHDFFLSVFPSLGSLLNREVHQARKYMPGFPQAIVQLKVTEVTLKGQIFH
jgi:hypothetical protein